MAERFVGTVAVIGAGRFAAERLARVERFAVIEAGRFAAGRLAAVRGFRLVPAKTALPTDPILQLQHDEIFPVREHRGVPRCGLLDFDFGPILGVGVVIW